MFDFVVVLGLDEAEDVADGGTDHGECDAGNHDSCEEHGFHSKKRPMVSMQEKAVEEESEADPAKPEEADNLERFVHF
jgi:hypothetical protein